MTGIWYQTIGGAIALADRCGIKGTFPNLRYENDGIVRDRRPRLLLEGFDMDALIFHPGQVEFIQFKVSTQIPLPPFSPREVLDILSNATHAILMHERKNDEKIISFIVASNRPMGKYFDALLQAVKELKIDVNESDSLEEFGNSIAPFIPLHKQKNDGRGTNPTAIDQPATETMRDLALKITKAKATRWGVKPKQCVNACLKAIASFVFAEAQPDRIEKALHEWLRTWGILPHEYDRYTNSILGLLLSQSRGGSVTDELSIMSQVFDSVKPLPLTLPYIGQSIVDELRERIWPDPPTKYLIRDYGVEDWILERPDLIRRLLYDFTEDPDLCSDPDDPYYGSLVVSPRIFVLVGPGGAGKSVVMAQLFVQIAESFWDWKVGALKEQATFMGCPIIKDAEVNALDGIPAALMKWGGRREIQDQPVERLANAYGIAHQDPAVWLGVDGMDEIPDERLRALAKAIANYADNHTGVRFVLTCRPDQFRRIARDLNSKRLMRKLDISEFDEDEARKAVLRATDQKLRMGPRLSDILLLGEEKVGTYRAGIFEGQAFEESIRQPLFIGVVHRIYNRGQLNIIQSASEGDPACLCSLAFEYMRVFCERMERRLNKPYISANNIYKAITHLAVEAKNPMGATASNWITVCERHLNSQVQWNDLYTQCDASGLIQAYGSGAFEWRHSLIGEYLPCMEEDLHGLI